jgi:hypothetical protein
MFQQSSLKSFELIRRLIYSLLFNNAFNNTNYMMLNERIESVMNRKNYRRKWVTHFEVFGRPPSGH